MSLTEIQKESLKRSIDFVKFAEAKNGAAIALSTGLIIGILQLRDGLDKLHLHELLAVGLCLLGGFSSVRGFIPILDWVGRHKKENADRNFLYFYDIAQVSADEFEAGFSERYSNEAMLCSDLAREVHENSKIAVDKFHHFSVAALFLSAACLLLGISVVLEIFANVRT